MNLEHFVKGGALPGEYAEEAKNELGLDYGQDLTADQHFKLLIWAVNRAYIEGEKAGGEDFLTKLPTRKSYMVEITDARDRHNRDKVPFAVAAFDLDNLKSVNDLYGHDMGNEYIVTAVKGLKKAIYRSTDKLFRVGGDEFMGVLHNIRFDKLDVVADRVEEVTGNELSKLDINGIKLGVSAGYTHSDTESRDGKMERIADQKMYERKNVKKEELAKISPTEIGRIPLLGRHGVAGSIVLGYTRKSD